MELIRCDRCGAIIRNVFLFQGNKYGSDCIEKIPYEESMVRDGINLQAVVYGLQYAKIKSADIDEIVSRIPAIGTRIDVHSNMYQVVEGYGEKQFRPRKHKEFVIRVRNIYPTAPRYNNYGWLSLRNILSNQKIDKLPKSKPSHAIMY